ncbi:hypothetical protein SANT12839_096660 [Streptomyces antimycoticus]|uniref:Uncharacterized protein n=1 Tax=Streptomyces antimycoticus TaxID=68175 RepID=A0A4D4KKT0_9ACTN|nr:hypothetical protein SANT12839_096660 [Streptomyces antimycoticus]
MVQYADRGFGPGRVAGAAGVEQQGVRVRCAADPRDVHGLPVAAGAERLPVEGGGLQQDGRVGAVVPAVQALRAQGGRLADADPRGGLRRRTGGRVQGAEHGRVGVRVGVE